MGVPLARFGAENWRSAGAAASVVCMHRVALALALLSVWLVTTSSPGQLFAIGCGIAAIGSGWIGYTRRAAPGVTRLVAAGAVTLGAIGLLLGALRVVASLVAIAHVEQLVAP